MSGDDEIRITELKQSYCRLVDAKDWPGFAALFTDDAVLYPSSSAMAAGLASPEGVRGRTAIANWVRERLATAQSKHEVWPVSLVVEGDAARAVWRMRDSVAWPERSFTATGRYVENYRRTETGWQIAETRLERD